MNRNCIHIAPLLVSILIVLLLSGCSSESSDSEWREDASKGRDLYLMLYPQLYEDITPSDSHRALPLGFVSYDDLSPRMADDAMQVHCFMTHAADVDFQGDFSHVGSSSWFSKIPLDDGTYQVYGFMPSTKLTNVKIFPQTNYETGARIIASGFPALTDADPCVIVGVKGASGNSSPIAGMDMQLGTFSYNAGNEGDHLYVLLDHLYAALHLRFNINSDYSKLRTIKLTRLSLTAQSVKTVDVIATLTAGSADPLQVAITNHVIGMGDEIVLFNGTGAKEKQLYPTTTLDFLACVAPDANRTFVMKTTYNVYDRQGNLIRENRTVENTLNISESTMLARGKKLIFNLTVNPTYIYVLSDPDLSDPDWDKPDVTVNP